MSSIYLYQEKKIIRDALNLASQQNFSVLTSKEDFGKKGLIGLWWDAKGFFNYSNKEFVLRNMDIYNDIHEKVVTCLKRQNSSKQFLELFEELHRMEELANDHVDGTSKTLCRVSTDVLKSHCKLEHKLKRAEFIVFNKTILHLTELTKDMYERSETLLSKIDNISERSETLLSKIDNRSERSATLLSKIDNRSERSATLLSKIDKRSERSETLLSKIDKISEHSETLIKDR